MFYSNELKRTNSFVMRGEGHSKTYKVDVSGIISRIGGKCNRFDDEVSPSKKAFDSSGGEIVRDSRFAVFISWINFST